jgi:cytosine/adenosine deaminase-related metal-dependent hydrolase
MVAIPGLIDTHSHADQSLLRGTSDDLHWIPYLRDAIDPWIRRRRPDQLLAAYRLSVLEMLRSGTTCFLNPNVDPSDDVAALAKVVDQFGMRAVLARWVEPDSRGQSLASAADAVADFRGAKWKRVQLSLGVMVPRQEGDRYDPAWYTEVAQASRDLTTGMVYHFSSEIEDTEFYEESFGVSPVEWADQHGLLAPNVALINACWLWEREIPLVASTGTSVVYSPTATMKMASGVTPVLALQAAGANVALGTDGGANNNTYDMIREMKAGVLLQNISHRRAGAFTAEQALELATLGGAAAIGRSRDLGSLEVGKRADLVLVDLDRPHATPVADVVSNLVYTATGADVHTVMVDGRLLVRDGRVLVADQAAVLAEAREAAAQVVGTITPAPRPRWPLL